MLPSHLLDPTKKKNEPLNRTRLGVAPPPLPPSLCVTGALSRIGRYKVVVHNKEVTKESSSQGGKCVAKETPIDDNMGAPIILSYCIFRPRQLHDPNRPPLLCLHGGPSIPSNYMLPIVNSVTDRTVIFYDQWGCGKSSRPEVLPSNSNGNNDSNTSKKAQYRPFSISTMVEHLRQLIEDHWKLKRFHLLGHSFGGMLAYEYVLLTMKRQPQEEAEDVDFQQRSCPCSLVLSSAPTSTEIMKSESIRLFKNLENGGASNIDENGDGENEKREQLEQSMKYSQEFRQTHECRLPNPPLSLMDAMAQMGPIPWRGIPAIEGYEAAEDDSSHELLPPALLMRGEYDLCTERCMEGWKELLSKNETTVLSNCSHYAMLEDERLYGKEILRFVKSHDNLHR